MSPESQEGPEKPEKTEKTEKIETPKARFKLSPSSLNLMLECPRCFWLSEHGIWRRPQSAFPSLPSGMDLVFKRHFDNFMEHGSLPPELLAFPECRNLRLFSDKERLAEWRNSRKGLWYEDSEGNILHGGVDNMMVNNQNDKLVVLDYKTRGFPLKEDTHEHYRDQLNIYCWLLKQLGEDVEDFAYLLFYYPKEVLPTGEVVFSTVLKKMMVDLDAAEALFLRAIEMLNSECPEQGCAWCQRF